MKRSILTEKVARRGYHVSREYSVDPLERISTGQVMSTPVITVPASLPMAQLVQEYFLGSTQQIHQGYPVVDKNGQLLGVITKSNLLHEWLSVMHSGPGKTQFPLDTIISFDLVEREPITARAWESCRTAAERMAQHGVGRLVVVADHNAREPIGFVTRSDLLEARARLMEEELHREGLLGGRRPRVAPKTAG
jgi:CBS-domain-containing membrane protein